MNNTLYYDELSRLGLVITDTATKHPVKIGLTGGFFSVLHSGHINLFEHAKHYCNFLIVAVNNDTAAIRKSGYSFMPFRERSTIISSLKYVDLVIENPFDTMEEIINRVRPHVYLKGGDVNKTNLCEAEKEACLDVNCEILFNIGGEKTASSSEFLEDYYQFRKLININNEK